MAATLQTFMSEYSQSRLESPQDMNLPIAKTTKEQSSKDPYATRKQRRAAVMALLFQMEQLVFAEERYRDNIPANLQGSKWYEAAESSISAMNEVIDLLNEIY
jgi:hypothetical protein